MFLGHKTSSQWLIIGLLSALFSGCGGIPVEDELIRMDRAQVNLLTHNKTLTGDFAWSSVKVYMSADGQNGYAWNVTPEHEERVSFVQSMQDNGSICRRFATSSNYQQCGTFYRDIYNNFYYKVTSDTDVPEIVGELVNIHAEIGRPGPNH